MRGRPYVKIISSDISNNLDSQKKTRTEEKSNQGKGIQCYECEGYGHIRPECPTFLKNHKKGLNVSWFDDDESEDYSNSETTKLVMALSGRCVDEVESCNENILYDDMHMSYNEACGRCEANLKTVEDQKKVISELESEKKELLCTVSHLQREVTFLNSKLDNMPNSLISRLKKGKSVVSVRLER